MKKENLIKLMGVILLVCGGIILMGAVGSWRLLDFAEAIFLITFGALLIFRGKIG